MKKKSSWWQGLNPFAGSRRRKRKYDKQQTHKRLRRLCQVESLEKRILMTIDLSAVPHVVVGSQDAGYSETGSGWQTWSTSTAYEGTERYHSASDGSDTANFSLTGLDPTKTYQLFVTYDGSSNHAADAPFTVSDGSSVLATVNINQTSAPDQATLAGDSWQSIGTYQTSTGTLNVSLADSGNGDVVANAVCAAEVQPVTSPPSIVDNADPAYAETGSAWQGWTESDLYGGDARYAPAGTGSNTASWTFADLDPTKTYQVYATWNASSNHASNAPYTIYDGSTPLATVHENQQNAPVNATLDGSQWESLGTYQASSGQLIIQLSDNANGDVVADAIQIVEVTPPTSAPSVVDNGDAAYAESGSAWQGWSDSSSYGGDLRYAPAGTGANTASWTFANLDPTKQYQVLATWNASSTHATNAPYTIFDGSTSLATIHENQQDTPVNATIDGWQWESLGTYQASSGTLVVQLSDNANDNVVADAIRLVEVTPPTVAPSVVDNGDAAYSESGSSWQGWSDSSSYEGDLRYAPAGTGANTATWTFQNVTPGYSYEVLTTYTASNNHASNAPYTILAGGSPVATVSVNQQSAPSGPTINGWTWQNLGTYIATSSTLAVQLSDDANGNVVADAVQLVPMTPLEWDPSGNSATPGGSGTWNTTSNSWYNPLTSQHVAWVSGAEAIFTPGSSATISGAVTVAAINFEGNGCSIGGGTIDLAGSHTPIDVASGNATIGSPLSGTELDEEGSGTLTLTAPGTAAVSNFGGEVGNIIAGGVVSVLSPTVMVGMPLPLRATVADPFGECTGVSFYIDTNGDGVVDAGDTLLGSGTDVGGVWSLTVSTTGWAPSSATGFTASAENVIARATFAADLLHAAPASTAVVANLNVTGDAAWAIMPPADATSPGVYTFSGLAPGNYEVWYTNTNYGDTIKIYDGSDSGTPLQQFTLVLAKGETKDSPAWVLPNAGGQYPFTGDTSAPFGWSGTYANGVVYSNTGTITVQTSDTNMTIALIAAPESRSSHAAGTLGGPDVLPDGVVPADGSIDVAADAATPGAAYNNILQGLTRGIFGYGGRNDGTPELVGDGMLVEAINVGSSDAGSTDTSDSADDVAEFLEPNRTYASLYGTKYTLNDNGNNLLLLAPDGTMYVFEEPSGLAGQGQDNGAQGPYSTAPWVETIYADGEIDFRGGDEYIPSLGYDVPTKIYHFTSSAEFNAFNPTNPSLTVSAEEDYDIDSSTGLCQSITYSYSNGTSLVETTQLTYQYYSDGDSGGGTGDLKSILTQYSTDDGSTWSGSDTYTFTYYTGSGSGGFAHGLETETTPGGATYAYAYDSNDRVQTVEIDDTYTDTFAYTEGNNYQYYYKKNGFPQNTMSNWTRETTVTLGDGSSTETFYTDFLGQTIEEVDAGPSGESLPTITTNYTYNTLADPTSEQASSSATGNGAMWTYGYSSVLIHDYQVNGTSLNTLSDVLTSAYVNGVQHTYTNNGQLQYNIDTEAANGIEVDGTVWYRASDQITGDSSTTTTYTRPDGYYSNSALVPFLPEVTVTTRPLVNTSNGGIDSSTGPVTTDVYNAAGQVVWMEDASGSFTYNQYDPVSGELLTQVQDINWSYASSYVGSTDTGLLTAAGLSLPLAGTNLVTTYLYDEQQRVKQTLGVAHYELLNGTPTLVQSATWTYYDDANHTTYSAQGFTTDSDDATDYYLVNPVSVTITDGDGKVLDQIQAVLSLSEGGPIWGGGSSTEMSEVSLGSASPYSVLAGLGTASQSAYVSWTSYTYTNAQLSSEQDYVSIPSGGAGSAGTNYNQTTYSYDALDRLDRTVTPDGLIDDVFYDAVNNVVQEWQGTDDGGSDAGFHAWVEDNSSATTGPDEDGATPMYKVSASTYDADGDMLQSTSYSGLDGSGNLITDYDYTGTNAAYTTDYQYNSQDLLTGMLGPDKVAAIYGLNEWGQADDTKTYANASYSSGTISYSGTPLTDTTTLYNARDLAYQTSQVNVSTSATLTTSTWYDDLNRAVETRTPTGEINKTTYTTFGAVSGQYDISSETSGTAPNAVSDSNDTFISVTTYSYDPAGNQRYESIGTTLASTTPTQYTVYANIPDVSEGVPADDDSFGNVTETWTVMPGTNGSTTVAAADALPDSSYYVDTISAYDNSGNQYATESPTDAVTADTEIDDLGEVEQTDTYNASGTIVTETKSTYQNGQLTSSSQEGGAGAYTTSYDISGDPLNRRNKVTDPSGAYTVTTDDLLDNDVVDKSYSTTSGLLDETKTYYDAGDRVARIAQGTSDSNLVPTTLYFYDTYANGTGSDAGQLTGMATLKPVSSLTSTTTTGTTNASIYNTTDWALTTYGYDGFDRQNQTTTPVPGDSDASGTLLSAQKTVQSYDSDGRLSDTDVYALDGSNSGQGTLISQSEDYYNPSVDNGIFLTDVYNYAVASGTPGAALDTHYAYGDYGRLVETTNPDGSYAKTAYYVDGTVAATYQGSAEGTGSSPSTVSGDTIVSQTTYQYDALGDVILTANYQRHEDDTSDTGALTTSDARVSYVADWYDSLGRNVKEADYGTNGGTSLSDLTSADFDPDTSGTQYYSAGGPTPDGSLKVDVTTFGYDDYGRQNSTTDNAGHTTLQVFDSLGRTIETIANYKSGSTYWGQSGGQDDFSRPILSATSSSDTNQITASQYNAAGQLQSQTAVTSSTYSVAAATVTTSLANSTNEYLIYSVEDLGTRWSSSLAGEHFAVVYWNGSSWQYNVGGGLTTFQARPTDVLVGTVSTSGTYSFTALSQDGSHDDILNGMVDGASLTYCSVSAGSGNFSVTVDSGYTGTMTALAPQVTNYIYSSDLTATTTISVSASSAPLSLTSTSAGPVYLMYSATDLSVRFPTDSYFSSGEHFVVVQYDTSSSTWKYDDGSGTLTTFTPDTTDILVGSISFSGGATLFALNQTAPVNAIACGYDVTPSTATFTLSGGSISVGAGNIVLNNIGSPVPQSGLLRATVYPDSTQSVSDVISELEGGDGDHDYVEDTYMANGALASTIDQRNVAHQYVYDAWGRQTEDEVTSLGSSGIVDGSVRAIVTTYNDRGLTGTITSYNSTALTTAVNKITDGYDEWGNVDSSAQVHTATGNSGTVGYTYDSDLDRLTNISYPTSFGLTYDYDTGSQAATDNALSRVAAVENGSTTYAQYTYLGDDTVIDVAHPDAGSLDMSLGNDGNNYKGLDPWGRLVDEVFSTGDLTLQEFKYGYDSVGDMLWRNNASPSAATAALDEIYSYDNLDRLTNAARGTLNGGDTAVTGTSTIPMSQSWSLDAEGNFSSTTSNGTTQTRSVDAANEIESITQGATTTGLSYDAAGNLIDDGTLKYTYDAWNRQVTVSTESGTAIAAYAYDGLGRRTTKQLYNSGGTAVASITEYYYDENGKVVEEQTFNTSDTLLSTTQYVWDPSNDQTPICAITTESCFTETLYYLTDANNNVTGLVDSSGDVVEQYVYDPYGKVTVCDASWAPLTSGGTNATTPGSSSAYGNNILFASYYYDAETARYTASVGGTGNYQVGAREYNSTLADWTTRDPMGYAAGEEDLYDYVDNGPTDEIDPSGEAPIGPDSSPVTLPHLVTENEMNSQFNAQVAAENLGPQLAAGLDPIIAQIEEEQAAEAAHNAQLWTDIYETAIRYEGANQSIESIKALRAELANDPAAPAVIAAMAASAPQLYDAQNGPELICQDPQQLMAFVAMSHDAIFKANAESMANAQWQSPVLSTVCAIPGATVHGVANGVVGVGKGVREIGYMGADLVNGSVEAASGYKIYNGDLSMSMQALSSGRIGVGQYYGEFAANTATAGVYGEAKAGYQYATGQINADEAGQVFFASGVMQLGAAKMMQMQGVGNTPIRLSNIISSAKQTAANLWSDESSGFGIPGLAVDNAVAGAAGLGERSGLGMDYAQGAEYTKPNGLGGINPTRCETNCMNCAIATAKTIAGEPTVAEPALGGNLETIENTVGGGEYFQRVSGQAEIEAILQRAGDGAQGIVSGQESPGLPGHVWNAANFGGEVDFIDGQALGNGLSNFDTHYGNLMFLLIR